MELARQKNIARRIMQLNLLVNLISLNVGLIKKKIKDFSNRPKSRLLFVSISILCSVAFSSCYLHSRKNQNDSSQSIRVVLPDETIIFESDAYSVTAGEVTPSIKSQLLSLETHVYNLYKAKALDLIGDKIKLSSPPSVSEKEVETYLKTNRLPLAQKNIVRDFLVDQRNKVEKELAVKSMLNSKKIKYALNDGLSTELDSNYFIRRNETSGSPIFLVCDFIDPICKELNVIVLKYLNSGSRKYSIFFAPIFNPSRLNSYSTAVIAACQEKNLKFWEIVNDLYSMQSLPFSDLISKLSSKYQIGNTQLYCNGDPDVAAKVNQRTQYARQLGSSQTFSGFLNSRRINTLEELQNILFSN